MQPIRLLLVLVAVGLVVSPPASDAQPLLYQGVLLDDQGAPLEGAFDLELSFFTERQGDAVLVVSPPGPVPITEGRFVVELTGIDTRGPALWWVDSLAGLFARQPRLYLSILVDRLQETARVPVLSDGRTLLLEATDGDSPSPDPVLPASYPLALGGGEAGTGGETLDRSVPAALRDAVAQPGAGASDSGRSSVVVATLELGGGGRIELVAVPETGDLGYVEVVPEGRSAPTLHPASRSDLLDLYLDVTPAGTPVPRSLAKLALSDDQREELGGRQLVERLAEPQLIDVERLGTGPAVSLKAGGSCGASGSQFFHDNHCDNSGSAKYSPIRFCDANYNGGNTWWYSLIRESVSGGDFKKRWNSTARTAACSTRVKVIHFYWGYLNGWKWRSAHDVVVQANTAIYSTWFGGSKRYRRVERYRLDGTGGFRAYTAFYNNV